MLNDFFMDVDNEAKIPTETANAIVEVHLQKFKNTISTLLKEAYERGIKVRENPEFIRINRMTDQLNNLYK